MLSVLFAASECAPYIKTGGLGDVIGSLPKALAREGVDVRVALPLYREVSPDVRARMKHLLYFYVNLGWRRQYCGVEALEADGVTYYFLDNEYFFDRPYVYGLGGDEPERFAFFCKAVLEMLPLIDFAPDVIHAHDWQAGLIPALLKLQYQSRSEYRDIRTVYTVHNLAYQGIFPIAYVEDLLRLGNLAYTQDSLEFYGQCSFMKGGLVFADRVTTVSPSYAEEVQTAFYGERLDGLMRSRGDELTGVLNGIDTDRYNPALDPEIERRYGADDAAEGKRACKLALQKELDLAQDENAPLIGMVTRLSGQKGLDLVERVINELMETGAQVALLGLGEAHFCDSFSWAQWKYPRQFAFRMEMNEPLAHRIYAGADLFLMPSRFEPCGLSQMIAMRYGTLPIVRETGGLRDTVLAYNRFTGEGNGFTFLNYNAHDMLSVVREALAMYPPRGGDEAVWRELIRRDMAGDYSWDRSARVYVDVYERALS